MKKGKRKPDDEVQSQRFVEAAAALDVDTTGQKFREAIKQIAPQRPKPRKQPS